MRAGSVSDGYLANLLASLHAVDIDANGLDQNDVVRLEQQDLERRQAVHAARRREAEERFVRIDANGDGGISQGELGEAMERESSGREQIEEQFRRFDRNGDGLVRLDEVPTADTPSGREEFRQIDTNGDGAISFDELFAKAAPRRRESPPVAYIFQRRDQDGDGLLSVDEWSSLDEAPDPVSREVRRRRDRFAHLLAIDSDSDGRLSEAELTDAFRRQFSRIDQDGDATISAAEVRLAEPLIAQAGVIAEAPVCPVPAPSSGAHLIGFAAGQGQLLSTVAVGSQDEVTSILDVEIEAGGSPLYLIVSSIEPVIWRLSGEVGRIERIVVFTSKSDFAGRALAAIVGVASDKVFFGEPGCFPAHRIGAGRPGSDNDPALLIAATTGVAVEAVSVPGGAGVVAVPSLSVHRSKGILPAPEGFDPDIWWDAMGTWPRGLAALDSASLVSQVPITDYEVLPSPMGPAQLVAQGVLKPTGNLDEYRIERPLSRFPGGMSGGRASHFVLPARLPMPAGDQGSGCIYSESGEIIGKNTDCRRSPRGDSLTARQREDGRMCLYSYGGKEEACFPEDGRPLQVVETASGRELRPAEPDESGRAPPVQPAPPQIIRSPIEIIPAGLRQRW